MLGKWILAAVAALLAVSNVSAGDAEHPLRNARPGDWVKYDMVDTLSDEDPGTTLIEVLANNDGMAKIRITQTEPRMPEPAIEEKTVDLSALSKPYTLAFLFPSPPANDRIGIGIRKGKTTEATVEVAGQQYDCVYTSYTVSAVTTFPLKEWTSPDVPVTGLVQAEMTLTSPMARMTLVVTLAASGDAANPPPAAPVRRAGSD